MLYKSCACSIKQIIFNKFATNLKTTISDRSLRISDLLLLQFFYLAVLLDIVNNIITYSTYSPYYVTNGSAVLLSWVSICIT